MGRSLDQLLAEARRSWPDGQWRIEGGRVVGVNARNGTPLYIAEGADGTVFSVVMTHQFVDPSPKPTGIQQVARFFSFVDYGGAGKLPFTPSAQASSAFVDSGFGVKPVVAGAASVVADVGGKTLNRTLSNVFGVPPLALLLIVVAAYMLLPSLLGKKGARA